MKWFVTEDGLETDLDLGHYERFLGKRSSKYDVITTGQVYSEVIKKERRGDYLGQTVQVIPHITDYIQSAISRSVSTDTDFIICEVGGTVGDIECLPFLEALRQFSHNKRGQCLFIHLTLLPLITATKELKTKPTQHSVSKLQSMGIYTDILLCRSQVEIGSEIKNKISMFCNLKAENIIPVIDVNTIYKVPLYLKAKLIDKIICKHFSLDMEESEKMYAENIVPWQNFVNKLESSTMEVRIAVVGKYTNLSDAYKSLKEALCHGGVSSNVRVKIQFLDAEKLSDLFFITCDDEFKKKANSHFGALNGIVVPGGHGIRGVNGKMAAIRYSRLNNIPFLGICYGMQLCVIEFVRNVLGIRNAGSTEHGMGDIEPIISLATQWEKEGEMKKRSNKSNLGGTMRLGSYDCVIDEGTLAAKIYNKKLISERHRHRFELSPIYEKKLNSAGMIISASSKYDRLPEIVEIKYHPWFLGVQFHPEFNSTPLCPSPVFSSFIDFCRECI